VRKISPHTGIRSPGFPARSESLYGLSYHKDGVIATRNDLRYVEVGSDEKYEEGRGRASFRRDVMLQTVQGKRERASEPERNAVAH
jgi:hypothetical protein